MKSLHARYRWARIGRCARSGGTKGGAPHLGAARRPDARQLVAGGCASFSWTRRRYGGTFADVKLPRTWLASEGHPWLAASVLYAALAVAVSWPLAAQLGTYLPLGRLTSATVPYFNLWTLEWNADRLLHGYAGYFDAPIFAPARSALLFSEPQGATGLAFAPLSWLFGGVAAYGVVLLCALFANGLAMRRCVRVAGGSELAATCCGALAVGLPFAHEELGVVQLTMLAPPLLVLSELIGMFTTPRPSRLLRAALWLAVTLWSCEYYALFCELWLLPAGVAWLLDGRARATLRSREAVLAALLLVSTCGPLVYTQRGALSGQERSAHAIRKGSATAMAYLRLPPGSLASRLLPVAAARGERRSAYPGLILLFCAAFGLRQGLRGQRRRLVTLIAIGGGLALLVGFGTRLVPGELQPYAWTVQRWLPGFAQLRSPYRLAAFVQLVLVLLAAFAFDAPALTRPVLRGRPLPRRLVAVTVVALALLETVPMRRPARRFPEHALGERWVSWLARQPDGNVLMLPAAASRSAADFERTALAMLQGLRHGKPLVTGYSGFFPPLASLIRRRAMDFPGPAAIEVLRRARVRYVVADDAWIAQRVEATHLPVTLPRLFVAEGRTVYGFTP